LVGGNPSAFRHCCNTKEADLLTYDARPWVRLLRLAL